MQTTHALICPADESHHLAENPILAGPMHTALTGAETPWYPSPHTAKYAQTQTYRDLAGPRNGTPLPTPFRVPAHVTKMQEAGSHRHTNPLAGNARGRAAHRQLSIGSGQSTPTWPQQPGPRMAHQPQSRTRIHSSVRFRDQSPSGGCDEAASGDPSGSRCTAAKHRLHTGYKKDGTAATLS